jgi:transcriptional/translational regulatory protein YebC/TACO1
MEAAIDAGAEDVVSDTDGHVVTCVFEDLAEVSSRLAERLGEAESVRAVWRPQNLAPVDEDKATTLMKLIDALEDDDDVQNVFANYEMSDEVMEKLAAA